MAGGGDWLNHLSAGAPVKFSTRRENLLSEVARNFQRNRRAIDAGPSIDSAPEGLICVRNDSGQDCQEFDVLGIADFASAKPSLNLPQFKWGLPVLSGVTPTAASHTGKFLITLTPIKSGQIGRAFIHGVCQAYVDIQSASDQFADVTDGDADHLTSGSSGAAQILWSESGTGLKWALVRLAKGGGLAIKWGKVTAIWTAGSNTIGLTPCNSSTDSTLLPGATQINVYVELPVSRNAAYCGFQLNEIAGYVSDGSGNFVLFRNPLPTVTAKYQTWYNNSSNSVAPNMVPDYIRSFS